MSLSIIGPILPILLPVSPQIYSPLALSLLITMLSYTSNALTLSRVMWSKLSCHLWCRGEWGLAPAFRGSRTQITWSCGKNILIIEYCSFSLPTDGEMRSKYWILRAEREQLIHDPVNINWICTIIFIAIRQTGQWNEIFICSYTFQLFSPASQILRHIMCYESHGIFSWGNKDFI